MSIEQARGYRQRMTDAYTTFNELAPLREQSASNQSKFFGALDAVDCHREDYERVVVELYRSGELMSDLAEQVGCRERDIRQITKTGECSFCSRPQAEGRLCAGANYDICELCVTSAPTTAPSAADGDVVSDRRRPCSFCDKVRPDNEIVLESQVDWNIIICNDCSDFARSWHAKESGAVALRDYEGAS